MIMAALLRSLAIAIREDLTVLFDHKSAKDEVGRPIIVILLLMAVRRGAVAGLAAAGPRACAPAGDDARHRHSEKLEPKCQK